MEHALFLFVHPFYNGASIYLTEHDCPFIHPFISWNVHCLLSVSINLLEHLLMHPFIPHNASISLLFILYIITFLCIHLPHLYSSILYSIVRSLSAL